MRWRAISRRARERPKQHGVDHAVDGGRRADPQRQNGESDDGEIDPTSQRSQREPGISQQRVHVASMNVSRVSTAATGAELGSRTNAALNRDAGLARGVELQVTIGLTVS